MDCLSFKSVCVYAALSVFMITGCGGSSSGSSPTPVPPPEISTTGVVAIAGDQMNQISWSPRQGSTYQVFWDTSPGVTTSDHTLIPVPGEKTVEHTGLNNGTTYYYRLKVNDALTGEFTGVPTASGVVGDLRASAEGSSLVVGGVGILLRSPDVSSWTDDTVALATSLTYQFLHYDIASDPANQNYVIVGTGAPGAIRPILYNVTDSNLATNWIEPVTVPVLNGYLTAVAYNSAQSLFVAVGQGGQIITASNPNTWSNQNSGTVENLLDVSIAGSGYLVVGEAGVILISPNGVAWSDYGTNASFGNLLGVASNGTTHVAVGNAGRIIAGSGGIWMQQSSGVSDNLRDVNWNGSSFVAVGESGTVLASENGYDWTEFESGTNANLNSVAWNAGLQALVFTGSAGTILTIRQ